ncbi:hypothetical protein HID58_054403 [Brassica napus]|uniref:Uncharacterized protein n=1 Tax=Brassica napus TaxID=3708 RepID=A0ABQ8AHE2_BRANA|nr:hypothetical protein HID58_054403 [Brassica napus]
MSCSSYKVNSESILKPNRYEVSCFDNLELEEPIYTHIYKGWLLHLALIFRRISSTGRRSRRRRARTWHMTNFGGFLPQAGAWHVTLKSLLNSVLREEKLEMAEDGSETTTRTTPAPTPKPKETNIKPRQSYINQPPSVSQEMIDEAAITAACKVVEAENKINVAKAAVEELEKTTKLADETELLVMHWNMWPWNI